MKREPLGNGFFVQVSENHTFGTDAVLLANFAAKSRKDSLVDLGTGCGIIPLLLLRDGMVQTAIGVEISPEAVRLANASITEQNRTDFSVVEADLCDLSGKVPFGCHTLVTCNPPYKAPGAGIQSAALRHAVARHEVACTLQDVVTTASKLLQTGGRFCICQRPERLAELMTRMHEAKLEPKRLRLVCQRKGEEPWLVLVEGKKNAHTGLRIAPTLYVEEDGKLSPEMVAIYGPYKEGHL